MFDQILVNGLVLAGGYALAREQMFTSRNARTSPDPPDVAQTPAKRRALLEMATPTLPDQRLAVLASPSLRRTTRIRTSGSKR